MKKTYISIDLLCQSNLIAYQQPHSEIIQLYRFDKGKYGLFVWDVERDDPKGLRPIKFITRKQAYEFIGEAEEIVGHDMDQLLKKCPELVKYWTAYRNR